MFSSGTFRFFSSAMTNLYITGGPHSIAVVFSGSNSTSGMSVVITPMLPDHNSFSGHQFTVDLNSTSSLEAEQGKFFPEKHFFWLFAAIEKSDTSIVLSSV